MIDTSDDNDTVATLNLRDETDEDSIVMNFYHRNHTSIPRVISPLALSDSINLWARSLGYRGSKIKINTISRVLCLFGVSYASTTDENGLLVPAFFFPTRQSDGEPQPQPQSQHQHQRPPAPSNNQQEDDYATRWLQAFLSHKTEFIQDSVVEYADFKSSFRKFMASSQGQPAKLPNDINSVLQPFGFCDTHKYLCKSCRRYRNHRLHGKCCPQYAYHNRIYRHVIQHMRILSSP